MRYEKVDGEFRQMRRVGGWGYLLGDDGSAYGIGREAIRKTLHCLDAYGVRQSQDTSARIQRLPPLSQAIIRHFQDLYPDSKPEDLLSTILVPSLAQNQADDASVGTVKRIADVAKVVLSMADSDTEALRIASAGVSSLVDLVMLLISDTGPDLSRSGLVLAGGMMKDELYKTMLVKMLKAGDMPVAFKHTETVDQPAVAGARLMLSCLSKTR